MRTLYLCYFGLREPLVQTQVLPYLRQISRDGIEVGLLTFEPNRRASWSRSEAGDWCVRLQADGIRWFALPYHKRPSLPATAYDIAAGGWMAARLVRCHGYDVVHARAHVAAAMGAIAKRLAGCRLIFDIRGFNPEEYVDAGVWPENGLNYRLAKRVERRLLAAADGFVVLTEKGATSSFQAVPIPTEKGGRSRSSPAAWTLIDSKPRPPCPESGSGGNWESLDGGSWSMSRVGGFTSRKRWRNSWRRPTGRMHRRFR